MNPPWGLCGGFTAPLRGAEVQVWPFPRVASAAAHPSDEDLSVGAPAADSTLGYSRPVPRGPKPIPSQMRAALA